MRQIEKILYLRTIDSFWMDHIDQMDYVRSSIGLQGYGQRDPLVMYKKEAFNMFQDLLANINRTVVSSIFKLKSLEEKQKEEEKNLIYKGAEESGQFNSLQTNQNQSAQEAKKLFPSRL